MKNTEERPINSLNIAQVPIFLRKLIVENPDLPLLVMAGKNANIDDGFHEYMACSSCRCSLGEFLDCEVVEDHEGTVYTDRDELSEAVEDYYYDMDEALVELRYHAYDPYWKKCIILYVDN